jgi:L-asparaginase/Glu-tRNA(Gln) amidotransferase subunit D
MRAWVLALVLAAVAAGFVGIVFAGVGPGLVATPVVHSIEATTSSFFPAGVLRTSPIAARTLPERFGKGYMN